MCLLICIFFQSFSSPQVSNVDVYGVFFDVITQRMTLLTAGIVLERVWHKG